MRFECPPGHSIFSARVLADRTVEYLLVPFLAETPMIFCIMSPDAKGGWHYRNMWAAETAFATWNGEGAPMAGEWRDFER